MEKLMWFTIPYNMNRYKTTYPTLYADDDDTPTTKTVLPYAEPRLSVLVVRVSSSSAAAA